jgi:hypothetical protein
MLTQVLKVELLLDSHYFVQIVARKLRKIVLFWDLIIQLTQLDEKKVSYALFFQLVFRSV